MRARGLKLSGPYEGGVVDGSRPMRARGLKLADQSIGHVAFGRAPCGRVG